MANKKGPILPDIGTIIQAGINPKTGLPIKAGNDSCEIQENIRKQLRILDEENAINRFVWSNLPSGLTGQMLERILYYKGQAAFFYMKSNDTFYFLPYALNGTIDVYGRFQGITPLPFNGTSQTNEKGKAKPWIAGLTKKPVYDVVDEMTLDIFDEGCVLLNDYSKQSAETIIPRQIIQDPLLDIMSEIIPIAQTNLIANCGVKGVRVQDETQATSVMESARDIKICALTGKPWIPITATTEFQEFTSGTAIRSQEYLMYLQGLDNYRLSLYGLETGGLFQKKSHMLEAEQNMNSGNAKLAYNDGLILRQNFCDIVNSIWNLGISCEPSESVLNVDKNGDGYAIDENEQSGIPGEQPDINLTEEGE